MRKEDMPGLLAAERSGVFLHHLEYVFVADRRAQHGDLVASQSGFKAHVGHRGGHYQISFQQIPGLEIVCSEQEDGISIDNVAAAVGEERAVGIAVKGGSDIGIAGFGFGGNDLGMQRAAVRVDVAAVRSRMGELDASAEVSEELGCDSRGGSVGTVQDKLETVELETRDDGEQKGFVVRAEGRVYWRRGETRGVWR